MKTTDHIMFVAIMLASILCTAVQAGSFSRYNLILERRPFAKAVAPDSVDEKVVTVEKPPAFVKDLRMCAITESPAGIKVGFINIRQKKSNPYYIYVGDTTEDGITIVDANYDKGSALLRKGGEQFWLYMGGGSSGGNCSGKSSRTFNRRKASKKRTTTAFNSYAERRRKRLEEMRKRMEQERKISDEEVNKKLQRYQMERIRRGLTPLPIKLSAEADAELVKEGLLPPLTNQE